MSLTSQYTDLRNLAGGMSTSVRGTRFNMLLADAFARDGVDTEADQRGPNGEVDVAFNYDGTWWLLEAKWYAQPIDVAPLRHLRDMLDQRRPGTMGILASLSGFDDSARRRSESARDVVLLDRPHLEALISGVVSGPELISGVNRALSVLGHPEIPLAFLLRPRRAEPQSSLALGVPDGFTAASVAAQDGVEADVIAHGQSLSGIAVGGGHLLITSPDGVMTVPGRPGRSGTKLRPRLELTGATGSPLHCGNGELLVVRGGGVLRSRADELTVTAGGFTRAPLLFQGPDAAAWLLDLGTDEDDWTGNQAANLVQVGRELGDEQRWPAGLPAGNCRAACWLHDRVFFVLGSGHSAVVDLDTGSSRWIRTPLGQPGGLIRLDERRVLLVGRGDVAVQVTILDTATEHAVPPVAVHLTGHVAGAARLGDDLYVLAGAPVDATIRPVVARLDLQSLIRRLQAGAG